MRSYLALAGKLAAAYLLFGVLWIFLSDGLLSFLFKDAEQIAPLQTGKGLLFVVLAIVMVVTRKVDWYQIGLADKKEE